MVPGIIIAGQPRAVSFVTLLDAGLALSHANLQPLGPHDEEVHLQEHASELSRLLVFQPAFVKLYRVVIALVGLLEASEGP